MAELLALVPGLEEIARKENEEDSRRAVNKVGGQEFVLEVPKIVSAEAAGTSSVPKASGVFGLGRGLFNMQEEQIPRHRLEVQVFTTNIDGGGTEDSAYVYFIGDKCTEGPVALSKDNLSKENRTSGSQLFHKGSIDTFEIEVAIGELQEIIVGKEPSQDAWHLLKVIVTDKWDGKVKYFLCEQWLANSSIALGNEIWLYGWDTDQSEPSERITYKVIVSTANVPGATCSANAFICIYGDKGATGKKWLGPKRTLGTIVFNLAKSGLQRGQTVAFLINGIDVGMIKRIRIGHDNRGIGDQRWKLDWIRVIKYRQDGENHVEYAERAKFIYNSWLGYGGEDSLCEVTLYAEASSDPSQPISNQQAREFLTVRNMPKPNLVDPKLQGRGRTDSEAGTQRLSQLTDADDGSVSNSGHDDGDQVESISDEEEEVEEEVEVQRDRFKEVSAQSNAPSFKYKVRISTSDLLNADYEGNACMELYGSKGKTPLYEVSGPFKRGVGKEFEETGPDIGQVEELMLYAQNFGDAWHLQDVYVDVVDNKGHRVGAYAFTCETWINSFNQPKSLLLLAHDISKGQREQLKILVYTNKEKGSGTGDNVYICLQGKEAKTRFLHLKASKTAYKKGKVAQFFRSTERLGTLRTIVIAIDGKKNGQWFPDQIEVVDLKRNEVYMFPNSEPLIVKKGKRGERRWAKKMLRVVQINPNAIKQPGLKCTYKAVFYTKDVDNAETTSNVSFVVYGDQGESGKVVITGGSKRFNKGQVDAIFFDAQNVGSMYKMRLALESRLPTSWGCTYAHVVNIRTGAQAIFVPDGNLATTTGTDRFKTIFAAGKSVPSTISFYKIVVGTGWNNANNVDSLAADFSMEIYGSQRAVTAALEPAGNEIAFTKGAVDVFTVESPSAGTIENAVIWFTPKNRSGSYKWDLQYVEIIDPKAMEAAEKAGAGKENGIADFLSQLSGYSMYMPNKQGILTKTDNYKRRLKKDKYPKGFQTLEARIENSGQKPEKEEAEDSGGGGFGFGGPFSMLRTMI